MRHLRSLVLALVLSPVIYICAGLSAAKLNEANELDVVLAAPVLLGLLTAVAAGGLYAILVMARLSPAGPAVAGLSYLSVTVWALLNADGFQDTMPGGIFGVSGAFDLPVGMPTALLAGPLLLTVVSPRRWRRTAGPDPTSYDAAPPYPASTPSAAPAYDSPTYDPNSYTPPFYTPSGYTPASSSSATEVTVDSVEPPAMPDASQR